MLYNKLVKDVVNKHKEIYVRDAQGNPIVLYEIKNDSLMSKEYYIYGTNRLGYMEDKVFIGKKMSGKNISGVIGMPNAMPAFPNPFVFAGTTSVVPVYFGKKRYELSDWLGNVRVVVSDRKTPVNTGTTTVSYLPQVLSVTDYYSFGSSIEERSYDPVKPQYRYGFNTQEKVSEITKDHYTAKFWEYDSRLGRRWERDPIIKYHESPYAILANNPIWFVDPNGADTLDIMKNDDGKWIVSNTQVVKGDDVFRVKVGEETKTYTFSEGEYGERINYLRLESNENETFGLYHLSGTSKTGYGLEPEGPSTYASGTNKRIPAGTYNLDYGAGGDNWPGYPLIYNDKLSKGRGVKIHYGTSRAWSEACIVVSSDYEINAKTGKVVFNLNQSQNASWELNQHLGATSRDVNHKTSKGKSRHKLFYKDPSKLRSTNLIIKE